MTLTAILTGPTATGKTGLGVELALERGNIEVVNADSMLVYRGMDIGTAKPTLNERQGIPHHLIDVRDPRDAYTAGDFVREARAAIADIHARGKRALVLGGTGFYLKALLHGLWEGPAADAATRAELEKLATMELYEKLVEVDPSGARRIEPSDRYRLVRALEVFKVTGRKPSELEAERPRDPDPAFRLWIIDRDDAEIAKRISIRTHQMIEAGLIEETKRIRDAAPGSRALDAVGYSQVCDHLDGRTPKGRALKPGLAGLEDEIALATRQLVKRQRTWFRGQHPYGVRFQLDQDRAKLEELFRKTY